MHTVRICEIPNPFDSLEAHQRFTHQDLAAMDVPHLWQVRGQCWMAIGLLHPDQEAGAAEWFHDRLVRVQDLLRASR